MFRVQGSIVISLALFIALVFGSTPWTHAGVSDVSSSAQVTFSVMESSSSAIRDDQDKSVSPTPEAIQIYRDAVKIEKDVSRGRIGEREVLLALKELIEGTNRVLSPENNLHTDMCNVVRIQVSKALAGAINSISTVKIEPAGNFTPEGEQKPWEVTITSSKIKEKTGRVLDLIEYLEQQLDDTYLEALLADLPRAVMVELPEPLVDMSSLPLEYRIEMEALELLQEQSLGLYLRAGKAIFKCSPTVLLNPSQDGEESTEETEDLPLILSVQQVSTGGFDRSVQEQGGLKRAGSVLRLAFTIPPGSYVRVGFYLDSDELQGYDLRKLGIYDLLEDNTLDYHRGRYDGKEGIIEFVTGKSGRYAVLVQSKSFGDIKGHWAQEEIEVLASQGIIQGTGEDKFLPEAQLTRAEFTAMLVRAFGFSEYDQDACSFKDVPEHDWYVEYLAPAVSAGLVDGYEDNTFRPYNKLTRQEMGVLVSRALGIAGKGRNIDQAVLEKIFGRFSDSSDVASWAREDLARVINANLMYGLPSGNFEPTKFSTRAESAVLLQRLLVYVGLMSPYPFDLY